MRRLVVVFLLLYTFSALCETANAWPFRRWRRTPTTTTRNTGYNMSDQAVAQAKANAMARNGRYSHSAGGYRLAGSFEGVGCGTSRNCTTCTPRRRMTLVADAAAYSSRTGLWYRCRGWR